MGWMWVSNDVFVTAYLRYNVVSLTDFFTFFQTNHKIYKQHFSNVLSDETTFPGKSQQAFSITTYIQRNTLVGLEQLFQYIIASDIH